MAEVFIELKGCDAMTEFNLVCTEEQLEFLREFAKMTKEVSTYSCMPVVNLYKRESRLPDEEISFELLDEDTPLKAKMSNEDEDSYESDTTKLV